MKNRETRRKLTKTPLFFVTLLSFLIIILLVIYIIYLRFIPYMTMEYDGYAVSGKDITSNLLNSTFNVDNTVKALKVSEQDSIYQNLNSYYLGASKQDNINLNYPIYINGALAVYNLSSDVTLITDDFQEIEGYSGFTLTSGALYNSNTLERADYYDYILMKNRDNLYVNAKEIKIKTMFNEYTIPMNSIINFTNSFITYYTLKNDEFVYNKVIDIDENSVIKIEDYNKEYTYKQFLIGLKIIKESKPREDKNNNVEANTETNTETENNTVLEPTTNVETNTEVTPTIPSEDDNNKDNERPTPEVKWIAPTVESSKFTANVYTSYAEVSIKDPSRVMKGVTYAFYKDGQLAFRTSATSSGTVSVTKLLPDTTYTIVAKYQYRNKEGSLIENTLYEQEITTKGIDILNPIELSFENGQRYSNKIEVKDIKISSDIKDEAVFGISKGEIIINGAPYSISSGLLRSIINGGSITYQSPEGLKSNSKYSYEINLYDTAGNKMNVRKNTGNTETSKKAPATKVNVNAQNVTSVTINVSLINEDKVTIDNYRYVLLSSNGEVVKRDNLEIGDNKLEFSDLDPENTYTIKVFGDFDIGDGNGMKQDQEIGSATFTTLSLSKLGSLKLEVTYDIDNDITSSSANLRTTINTDKTDHRLVNILQNVTMIIRDSQNNEIKSVFMDDINSLKTDGIANLFENLESNTTYKIELKAVAKQGSVEKEIVTSYTTNSFMTNKKTATLQIRNVIATTNLIDMDIYIDDEDGAVADNLTIVRMVDRFSKEYLPTIEVIDENKEDVKSTTKIPTNRWIRLTYEGLTENEVYTFTCEAASYNETNNANKVQNNYQIGKKEFTTSGLGGSIDLIGLQREIADNGKNLIDVSSNNNWYAKTFGVLETEYVLDNDAVNYETRSKYNYGKTYDENSNQITFLSNQCYVYDLGNYVGEKVTLSFKAQYQWKDNNPVATGTPKIYMQLGKGIGRNITELSGITTDNWAEFVQTITVPDDGFVGFYLEDYSQVDIIPGETNEDGEKITDDEEVINQKDYYLKIRDLQAEKGNSATSYEKYKYTFYANMDVKFIDENHVTFDESANSCKYYIKITSKNSSNQTKVQEFDYNYDSVTMIEEVKKYIIEESGNDTIDYTVELMIRQYGREYVLSQVTFEYDVNAKTEIKSISTVDEFLEIQPNGNYILLNDIDLSNAGGATSYTFGNPNITFNGTIDFNGKTITKDTYSLTTKREVTSYIFYKLGAEADLKNIVIDYSINSVSPKMTVTVVGDKIVEVPAAKEDGYYSLFLYNEGSIDNVIVRLKKATQRARANVALLGYDNSGKIDNFIIDYEVPLYASQYIAGVCLYSHGTIQNGYIYGQGIETYGDIAAYDYRYIGGVAVQLDGNNGLMQNIFNTTTIKINHTSGTYSYAGNIVYDLGYPPVTNNLGQIISRPSCSATVRNVYSVMSIITAYEDFEYSGELDADNKEQYLGPSILNKNAGTNVNDCYYFCEVMYDDSDYNTKTASTGLYEPGVQEVILNANSYKNFTVENLVSNGYYPQLKLNYCMPKQDNVKIDITGNEIIDILSGSVIENNDISSLDITDKVRNEINSYIAINNVDLTDENTKLVSFRVYNPAGTTISVIDVDYLDEVILSQSYSKRVSTVYMLLNNPTSFLDTYNVSKIQSKQANGVIKTSVYGENEAMGTRYIDVRFVKKIANEKDWTNINQTDGNGVSGLIQNYRLVNDLNFADSEYSPYITGTFTGYLDGEYEGKVHTINNISGTESLFAGFAEGEIKNLNINNFTINTNSQYAGMIAKVDMTDNILIDNVSISNMEMNVSYNKDNGKYGGIAGYISSGSSNPADSIKVQNCSVQGFDLTFNSPNSLYIDAGGIVGSLYAFGGVTTYVQNCYVQNYNVEATNVTQVDGIGGIVGYKRHDADEKIKAGSPVFYIQNCYTTGRINTFTNAGGILGFGKYGSCYVRNCYSLINLNTKTTSGNIYFGGIAGYSDTGASGVQNCLFLGNIYIAGNTGIYNFNRILGSNGGTTSYNNYAYADQLMSGEKKSDLYGATKLLKDNEIFTENTFTNLLKFDDNFARTIVQNGQEMNLLDNRYFPQLMNTSKDGLLANQKLITLDNDLKLYSITSTPSEDKTNVTVEMKFENPNDLSLTGVTIEDNDMSVVEGSWTTSKEEGTGLTIAKFVATPNKAFESYKIENIIYTRDGINFVQKEISTKIKVTLYKGISNADEWNDFFENSGKNYIGQNVRITGDIDFSTVDHIVTNVVIGRLEGSTEYSFKNVNISVGDSSGLIKEIKTNCANIHFKDSKITCTGNYSGIISILRGEMKDCTFDNIIIEGGKDYVGVVSRAVSGRFNNIILNKMNVTGGSYVGSLCGYTASLGSTSNIKGTYLQVTASGDYAGGIFGSTQNAINGVYAYQYSENGKKDDDEETDYLIKGRSIIGGVIGEYGGSGSTFYNSKVTNSIILGTGNYIGANCGNGASSTNNMVSTNNVILGANYVGGNNGQQGGWSGINATSENNIIIATNNLDKVSDYKTKSATGSYVGGNYGNTGWSSVSNPVSRNNYIKGLDYVAGNVGRLNNNNATLNNSLSTGTNQEIIGRNYVSGSVGWTNGRIKELKVENCQVTASGNYVGGAVGYNEYTNTSISTSNNSNYSTAGAYVSNVTIIGSGYVGGIAGYERGTIHGGVVNNNTTITGNGNYVGGIVGYYTGYVGTSANSIKSSNYYLWHSYIEDSYVKGANYVGGIAGGSQVGNIQYCYAVNTDVTATGEGAGGIVGYFDNSKLNNLQYKATIKYNYVANSDETINVSAKSSAGGLIGEINKQLNYDPDVEKYNIIECNLIATDVISTSSKYADMGIASIKNSDYGLFQAKYMNNIYVYNGSNLQNQLLATKTQVSGIVEENENYKMITSDELKVASNYTKNVRIYEDEYEYEYDEEGNIIGSTVIGQVAVGNEGLNFGTGRYNYKAGYFPTLKPNYSAGTYWSEMGVAIKEFAIPERTITFDEATIRLFDEQLTSEETLANLMLQNNEIMPVAYYEEEQLEEDLPQVYVYAVGADKINIEFSKANTSAAFSITANGEIISEKQKINQRVYTFEYDFKSPFTIKITNADYWDTKDFEADDIRNMLVIANDEYFYLSDESLNSNKRTIKGNFVNLYEGEVLDSNGNIYDLSSMKNVGKVSGMKLLEDITPITESTYLGKKVQTFYHCTKVTEEDGTNVFKDGQIFIKKGIMYVVDGNFSNVGNSVIIDSYNNKQYEATLGTDGKIYNLLTDIKYPVNFKNEKIIQMTNNLNNDSEIVLIYSATGNVYGFNYITGEEIYDNGVNNESTNFVSYLLNGLSLENLSYKIDEKDYKEAQELVQKLEKKSIADATSEIGLNQTTGNDGEGNSTNSSNTITETNTTGGNSSNSNQSSSNNTNAGYVTAYNANSQNYVVYSANELLDTTTSTITTENAKINKSQELTNYYNNISTGKKTMQNIGTILITIVVLAIILALIIMYRKSNR